MVDESKSKKDLVNAVSASAGMSKTDVQKVIDHTIDTVIEWVKVGYVVNIVNFCRLPRKKREARTGRNPRDGSVLQIPASWAVSFVAGKLFKTAVKEHEKA